ncbi:hypothetical protein FC50_GL000072 [Lacticaseibacillus pantheris DSM 15945 = JCM 12539 = NBRC 106106]|uniref:Uncharacterized protein n=1 Tax=Lacticaseibacillus pantheris DSM 15945 = JCM 12539 = NBRC 106106 TaxID=1423783 RepID=A0A0R1U6D8_9LACO|nr:hypothetical protein FC50_GL000072 [Lacticaseibacillus pantheris DSM 15945 = JCM 12539 = NBRC 106106]
MLHHGGDTGFFRHNFDSPFPTYGHNNFSRPLRENKTACVPCALACYGSCWRQRRPDR